MSDEEVKQTCVKLRELAEEVEAWFAAGDILSAWEAADELASVAAAFSLPLAEMKRGGATRVIPGAKK